MFFQLWKHSGGKAGDDFGGLSLYKWPCVAHGAGRRYYDAVHASHVFSTRFNVDGIWLGTAGTGDGCAFLWSVLEGTENVNEDVSEVKSWRDAIGQGKATQRKQGKQKNKISKERLKEMEQEVEALARRRAQAERRRRGEPETRPVDVEWGEVPNGRGVMDYIPKDSAKNLEGNNE